MKKLLVLLFFCPTFIFSQLENENLNKTLDTLLELIDNGDTKAISDLSDFLDDKRPFVRKQGQNTNTTNLREVALSILYYYSDFDGLSITDSLTTSSFKIFLYKNNSKIKYSSFLKKFINVPLNERKVKYRLRKLNYETEELSSLQTIKSEIQKLVNKGRYYSIIKKIEEAAQLKTNEVFKFLKECADGKHWGKGKNDRETQIYSGICYSLRHFETIESAKLIVEILEKNDVYSIDECILALSKITNIDLVVKNQSYENIAEEYKKLLTTHTTIEDINKFGYETVLGVDNFEPDNIVESYGKIILNSSDFWWTNYHALQDIFSTNDPISLKYVGAQLHRKVSIYNDHLGRSEFDIQKIMENKTGLILEVKDDKGNWTSTYNDPIAKVNYLLYWYNHYQDYKWNSIKKQFENTQDQILEPDQIDVLFKRLYHKNDSIALDAYTQLTQHNPEAVKNKIDQYNLSVFSGINLKLPSFAKKSILQLIELTAYCKTHKITFNPSKKLIKRINELDQATTFKEKYQIENQLIKSLNIEDITPLEYYTLIHDKANNSISRIVDKWYSENWDLIINDEKESKLYLKKTALYNKLGIIGNVNKYIFKFNNSKPSTIKKLKTIAKLESDDDIKKMVLKALNHHSNANKNNQTKKTTSISLSDFLSNIHNKSIETASLVKINSDEDYKKVFEALTKANKKDANKLINIITSNIDIKMTPYFIKSLDINTVIDHGNISRHDTNMNYHSISYQILVSDKIVVCLEFLHNHAFPLPKDPKLNVNFVSSSSKSSSYFRNKHKTANKWVELYEKNTEDYKNWGRNFYLKKIENLKNKDSINIKDINEVLASNYYKKEDKNIILSSLKKVQPKNEISYLQLKKDTLSSKDIKYFKNRSFSAKDIQRITSLFDRIPPKKIIEYIKEASKNFTKIKKGKMYSKLMRNTEFKNWIQEININNGYKNEIVNTLKTYRNTLSKDSFDYSYVNKFIGIIALKGKSTEEKIKQVILMKEKGVKLAKSILKNADYIDLGIILKYYNELHLTNNEKIKYLTQDLGFCLPVEYSDELINEFKKNYNTMNEFELYSFYLNNSGVSYKKNGALNFNKIYDILKFNLIDGFTGGKGYERIIHVYSIIKLLEIHFNVHFGKDKNFNEMISNFGYDTSEKTFAWMKFLKDKGHVIIPKYEVPSISNIR